MGATIDEAYQDWRRGRGYPKKPLMLAGGEMRGLEALREQLQEQQP